LQNAGAERETVKAGKATVAVVALSLALTVGGAVLSPTEPASANPYFPTSQAAREFLWSWVAYGAPGGRFPPGFPLNGLDFSGFDFPSAGYYGVNWSNSNFSGADLELAQLAGGNFKGANLTGANLSGANLSGATLRVARLVGANLTGANLTGTDMSGANLTSVQGFGSATKKWAWYSSTTICPNGKKYGIKGANC